MSGLTIYPPFGHNTDTRKDGLVLLSAALNVAISLLALPFTVIRKGKPFGISDGVACIAVISSICQCVPLFVGRAHGMGTTSTLLSESKDSSRNGQYILASEELYVVSLGFQKLWVVAFAWRLAESSHMPNFRRGCATAMALAFAWTIGSVVALVVNCSARSLLDDSVSACPAQVTQILRWLAICVVDVVSDIVSFVLGAWLIWPLQIETADKVAVILSFMLKLGGVPLSVARLLSVQAYASSSDAGIAIVDVIIWQNAQLGWATLSAAAPSMLWMRNSFNVIRCEEGDRVLPSMFGDIQHSSGARTGRSNTKKNSDSEGNDDGFGKRLNSFAMRRIAVRKSVPGTIPGGLGDGLSAKNVSDYNAKVQAVPKARRMSNGSGDSEAKLIRVEMFRSVVHETRND